jgi:hypothetical protein
LAERGEFVQPASAAGLFGDIDTYSNPVRQFLLECPDVVLANDQTIPVRSLYNRYDENWRFVNSIKAHGDSRWFGRQLRAAMRDLAPGVAFERKQHNAEPGRPWYYHGIGLHTPTTLLKSIPRTPDIAQ